MTDQHSAEILAAARKNNEKLLSDPGPEPSDADAAFMLQQRVTQALGWNPAGWKIGCTNEMALRKLGATAPFPGPVFTERVYADGEHVPTADWAMRLMEPEIAFTMASSLPARTEAYTVEEVLACVESVHTAIETVNRRAPGGFEASVNWHIADGGLNDALTLGPANKPLAREDYAHVAVQASVNGIRVTDGNSARAMGGPELALTWLANYLSAMNLPLLGGDVVSTGVLTDLFSVEFGDEVRADYDKLGSLHAGF